MRARRASALAGCAAFVFALHCARDRTATFSPAGDQAFVASIEGTYEARTKAGDPVSLLLCEDTSPSATVCVAPDVGSASSCPAQCHVIASGAKSKEETLSVDKDGCGCGGAYADLAVVVSLSFGGGLARMNGTVNLAPSDDDAYGEPRRLFASARADRSTSADVSGFFGRDGRLDVDVRAAAESPAGDAGADAGDGGDAGSAVPAPLRSTIGERLVFAKVSGPGGQGSCRSP